MLATLKRFYLYAALTIAVIALSIGLISLITLALEAAGLRDAPLTDQAVREGLSIAIAILLFAVPIGGFHLWLILRSLGEPEEATCWPRYLFLNAWIVIGLVLATTATFGILNFVIVWHVPDVVASQVATLAVAVATVVAAWRWRESTPGGGRVWGLVGAFATMAIATFLAVGQIETIAFVLRGLVLAARDFPPVEQGWAALAALPVTMLAWGIGFRWQLPWRTVRFRHVYATALYALGVALLTSGLVQQLTPLLAAGRGELVDRRVFTSGWELMGDGLFLVVLHLAWMFWDRGRFGQPARVTDRLVFGPPAIVGLAVLVLAWTEAWTYLTEDVLRVGTGFLRIGERPLDLAIVAGALGLILYPLASWRFTRATSGEPRSALRRGYLFAVIGTSLVATVVTGALAAYWSVSLVLGTSDAQFLPSAVEAAGSAVGSLAILVAHGVLLWRDVRTTVPTEKPVAAADPLIEVLEGVATGHMRVRDAAARIHAMGLGA